MNTLLAVIAVVICYVAVSELVSIYMLDREHKKRYKSNKK